MSRNKLLITLVAGLVSVAAFAAIAGASGTSGGVSLACKNGFITIGIAKAQSGDSSFSDVAGTRGTKIAIDEINASGGTKGCKLKTIEGDTKSDPGTGGRVARQLISRGAQILIVPDDFDLGIAAARAGQRAGVLTLSLAASSTQFGKAVGNLFFNAGPTTTQLAQKQAHFALLRGASMGTPSRTTGRRRTWSSTRAWRTSPIRTRSSARRTPPAAARSWARTRSTR